MIKYKIFDDGTWLDEQGNMLNDYAGADEKLTKFAETHKIVKTHFQIASSSDWNVQSGGTAYILAEYESEDGE
ncbi:hypothetical protein [Lactococcus allomyrinae]|uniref:Uncharacterized protein n=1 Tax=Lactococcus allomyrinae TaxID=2419773 RepID=A0A387BL05_9LACT|nr:hypothetical protein [Lactococcus allomyrinae]AYG01686.1 hypothetical protein D7I46_11855 [Lactococcus allomyrinae]